MEHKRDIEQDRARLPPDDAELAREDSHDKGLDLKGQSMPKKHEAGPPYGGSKGSAMAAQDPAKAQATGTGDDSALGHDEMVGNKATETATNKLRDATRKKVVVVDPVIGKDKKDNSSIESTKQAQLAQATQEIEQEVISPDHPDEAQKSPEKNSAAFEKPNEGNLTPGLSKMTQNKPELNQAHLNQIISQK